jgi:monoamine oxidase
LHDVLVIGAGMAGITAAREIARRGLSVTVVEARDRTGGRVHTLRDFCGHPVEGGAEFVHTVDAETWPEIRAARLAVRKCPVPRRTMFNLGGRTRWLPWILMHPGVWSTFPILRRLAHTGPTDMSAGDFIERHGYRGEARLLAEMVFTGHLPGTAHEIGVLGLVEDRVLHLHRGSFHRITDGYDRLIDHIVQGLDVRLGFPVSTVHWAPDGVTVTATDGRALSARAAITTLPVGVLASGAVEFVPALPGDKRRSLEELVMGPVLKLLLHFREPFWPARMANLGCGTGPVTIYWPAIDAGKEADGTPAVLTAYCTGPRAAHLSQLNEADAVAVVLADLARLFPGVNPAQLLLAHRRIDWSTDPFARGGYTFVRTGASGARDRLAAPQTGALFWAGAGTTTSTIADTVQAAYVSGIRAAGEVLGFFDARYGTPIVAS